MTWTRHHGAILAKALGRVLGRPEAGVMAFVRCLTPDVVDSLARDTDHFRIVDWRIRRVADAEDRETRTITADQAVEIREGKAKATLLLIDTGRAGAGMDGVFSATREVGENDLFREAHRLAAAEITGVLSAGHRKYAERALSRARSYGGRFTVSPWTQFDFYCHVAMNSRPAGAYLHLLGLWPVKGACGEKDLPDLDTSRRFVDRLLDPGVSERTPAERIDALRLLHPTQKQLTALEKFLREAATLPIRSALPRLVERKYLWVNSLRTEGASDEILTVELLSWRTTRDKMYKWSGLTDRGDEVPALIVDPEAEQTGKYAKLEVRWKARPKQLAKAAAEYRVAIVTSGSQAEIASWEGVHSAKAHEKCIFTQDDLPDLSEDAVVPARVVLSVVGSDSIVSEETEEFEIVCGERPDGSTPVGKRFRTFSDALIELGSREEVEAMTSLTESLPTNVKGHFLVWKSPSRRKNFRVYRPPLIKEAEDGWRLASGAVGRWRIRVRLSGERVGVPEFVPFDRPEVMKEEVWQRAQRANRKMVDRFGDVGGVGQVYNDRSRVFKATVSEYIRSWIALLRAGDPQLALAQTVEVQSQSGDLIGLIVLPGHPLRMAWHAAYDNLVLHTAFDEKLKPADVRKGMEALDGAVFPAFLPGITPDRSFVFADTLGFHAVGMVADNDPEPKGTLAILQTALSDKEAEGSGAAPTVGSRSADVLGKEICKYLESHEAAKILHIHALRAGDGKTVVRSLGQAARLSSDGELGDQLANGSREESKLVYVLEIHPSRTQWKRSRRCRAVHFGVAGETQEGSRDAGEG